LKIFCTSAFESFGALFSSSESSSESLLLSNWKAGKERFQLIWKAKGNCYGVRT
jgi:hypothetical protein